MLWFIKIIKIEWEIEEYGNRCLLEKSVLIGVIKFFLGNF